MDFITHFIDNVLFVTIIIATLYTWIKQYKNTPQDLKKYFIITTSLILMLLTGLCYTFVDPYCVDLQSTALMKLYYKWSILLAEVALYLFIFLQARYVYNKTRSTGKMRLVYESTGVAVIAAIIGYYYFLNDTITLETSSQCIVWIFIWTLLYVIIRNWIYSKMLKFSDK